jgi:hypothetical protein
MKKVIKLTESDLSRLVKRVLNESHEERGDRYMFFSNLEQMKRQCEFLLEQDRGMIEGILDNGHDWAQDHIAESKNNMDQVFDFMMNEFENRDSQNITEAKEKKNKPTNPKLWSQCLSWARSRYKVCPSAYCNGAAAKRYKKLGGKWKK